MVKKALPYIFTLLFGALLMWLWDYNTMHSESDLDAKIQPFKDKIVLQEHKIRLYELQDENEDSALVNIIIRQDSVINGIRNSSTADYIGHANGVASRLVARDKAGD